MRHWRAAIVLLLTIILGACKNEIGDYTAASTIASGGFAHNGAQMSAMQGAEVMLWGFVDHGNLYGDAGAKEILTQWWSGEGQDSASWRFNLKGRQDDKTGQSFAVHVRNDSGRDALLDAFATDARMQRPTKVFLRGRLFTFDAPIKGSTLTGIYVEVESSRDIQLAPPDSSGK